MIDLVDHALPPSAAEIVFVQTACGPVYEAMLEATAPIHRAYCAANGLRFVTERGVRRGFHPWQATFNRIEILHELLESGFDGWFLYIDADALIWQPAFDMRRFLGKRAEAALIIGPGGPQPLNINAGVFFLNLGQPVGRDLVRRWYRAFHEMVSLSMLRAAEQPWQPLPDGSLFPDDQHLLQAIILAEPCVQERLIVDRTGLIRSERGRLVRQLLRSSGPVETRLERLGTLASEVVGLADAQP